MHTGHILLVEADSSEEALGKVNSILEEGYFDWSDWSQVGGRYRNFYVDGDVLGYTEDTEKFEEALAKALQFREGAFENYKERLDEKGITLNSLKLPETFNDEYDAYPVYLLARLAAGISNPDTMLWDYEYGSPSLTNFRERLAEKAEQQFLVVVDFHF